MNDDESTSKDWIDEIIEKDKDKVRKLFNNAKTIEDKSRVLQDWHPQAFANLKPIKNLEEYFKYIRFSANDSTWFRGESMDHGQLIPKLYRGVDQKDIEEQLVKEQKYFLEFRRRAQAFVPSVQPNDTWSWYFLIQHYGGATRLLDWTQDAAMALFFALDSNRDSLNNPIIALLSPTVLIDYAFVEIGASTKKSGSMLYPGEHSTFKWITNILAESKLSQDEIPNSPISLLPPYSDPRIIAQRSCFTLFGKEINGFNKNGEHIVCPCCGRRIISKLVIDGREKNNLRKELTRIGISSGKVFPGLDGLAKEITEEIYNNKKHP